MTPQARRRKPSPFKIPFAGLFLLLALGLWTLMVFKQWPAGNPGFLEVWAKGLALLTASSAAYFSLARGLWPKSLSLLSLYPLAWLALSRAGWHLCAQAPAVDWLAVLLFLGMVFWMGLKADGKILLGGLVFFWTALDMVWTQALLLPLAFLTARKGVFKNSFWLKAGGAGLFLILFLATRGWTHWQWNGPDFSYWFFEKGMAVFGIFALLGWAVFPRKGTSRSALVSVAVLGLGALGLNPPLSGHSPGFDGLTWILVWAAGFGFESLRRDLIDTSWHGRAVWAALGLAAFWGVF
jgi:hypothetical protein